MPTQTVVITPTKKDTVKVVKVTKVEEQLGHKKFDLNLMLSLNVRHYLEKDTAGNYAVPDMEALNLSALEFYEGILLARDKSDSLINVSVTDAAIDSFKILKLLQEPVLKKSDLVVLMLNPALNPAATSIAARENYPLMITQNQTALQLSGYKRTWLASPSNKTQCAQMADYLKNKYPHAAYSILYRDNTKKEGDLAGVFANELQKLGVDSSLLNKINCTEDGWSSLVKILKQGKRNIVIIPSSDEAFLSALLTKMDTHEEYDFLVVGIPTWEYFESIDMTLLEGLNTHIFNAAYLDYDNDKVKQFRKRYIEEYSTDPLPSAYLGYDVYRWVSENYPVHGNDLEQFESTSTLMSPEKGFEFSRICSNCGFENQYISVLIFKEGRLIKVNQ